MTCRYHQLRPSIIASGTSTAATAGVAVGVLGGVAAGEGGVREGGGGWGGGASVRLAVDHGGAVFNQVVSRSCRARGCGGGGSGGRVLVSISAVAMSQA